jgi:hypothetical protein
MWLIARITTDGRDCVARFSRGHTPVGEPRLAEVQELLAKHGYEATMGTVDRKVWPLLVIAYRSRNREGIGHLVCVSTHAGAGRARQTPDRRDQGRAGTRRLDPSAKVTGDVRP